MALTVVPARIQPPTMPTGAWEVNTQCEQATGLLGFLDTQRRRFWWRGRWIPMYVVGLDRNQPISLPIVGGAALDVQSTGGWMTSAVGALSPGIGVSTPYTAHAWAMSRQADTVDKTVISMIQGATASRMTLGDSGTPANVFKIVAKTTGASAASNRSGFTTPQDNVVYALTMVDRIDTFPDFYLNGVLNNGVTALDNGGNRPAIIDTIAFGTLIPGTPNPLLGMTAYGAVWEGRLPDTTVYSLWDPDTRWDLMWQKKNIYFDLSAPAKQDTPPSQYARPKYITLNEFSPQAQGLYAWIAAVGGPLSEVRTPAINDQFDGTISANTPGNVLQPATVTKRDFNHLTLVNAPPQFQISDFGMVARSYKGQSPVTGLPEGRLFWSSVNLVGLTNLTITYWICPFPSIYTEAAYWTAGIDNTSSTMLMTNSAVRFNAAQTLTFTSNPHLPGRWQMITISRTLNGITVWRDQEIVATVVSAGSALTTSGFFPWLQMGGAIDENSLNVIDAVDALWADFRVYSRAWDQNDVNYAYNPATRWDYYWQPRSKPYEDFPFPLPPVSGYLSRLALLGMG